MPTSVTLKVLHDVIQITVGWFDCHLWRFTIGGQSYGPLMPAVWDDDAPGDATKVRLRDVLESDTTIIDYLYDFGNSWEHRLAVTNIRQGDPDLVGAPGHPASRRTTQGSMSSPSETGISPRCMSSLICPHSDGQRHLLSPRPFPERWSVSIG